jgi:hypothetical protein
MDYSEYIQALVTRDHTSKVPAECGEMGQNREESKGDHRRRGLGAVLDTYAYSEYLETCLYLVSARYKHVVKQ